MKSSATHNLELLSTLEEVIGELVRHLKQWLMLFVLIRVGRFRIPLDGRPRGELHAALDPEEHGRGMDMCSINPVYLGKKYRYAYACGAKRPCKFPNTLTKIDLVERKAKNWYEDGAVPSEPFFVARPGATEEDDGKLRLPFLCCPTSHCVLRVDEIQAHSFRIFPGVVISIVSDKNGEGYALVLDGVTFEEIARAKFPYGLPYGLHGCWVPNK
ncbi:hypothetical protein B296_00001818 [Ensete ventricosum]|uniref:Uncharacterized protein n=1 Tax=Ensete ventricosum TaxID=4639 RepID=A0A426ZZ67_ENSVE|nr:hypothetical protein B296_00001818 [Ensete ventricosum]